MKKIFTLLAFVILSQDSFALNKHIKHATPPILPYYTMAPGGDMTDPSIWSNNTHFGPGCSCSPGFCDPCRVSSSKFIYISHPVTLNCDLVLDGNSTIVIESGGSLTFTGNATVSGTGDFLINPGGSVMVNGTLNLIGTGNVTVDGSLNVGGDLVIDAASTFCGTGTLIVSGTVSGDLSGCFTGSLTVLPVRIISFNAIANDSVIDINWVAASQLNNDFFTIERSANGENFTELIKIDGAGTLNQQIDYFEKDFSPLPGTSYYRLKQTDFNGAFTYSQTIAVKRNVSTNPLTVYPNPANANGEFFIAFSEFKGEEVLVVIRDITGKEFYSKLVVITDNNQIMAFDPDQQTPAGIYLVVASSKNELYRQKLVVK